MIQYASHEQLMPAIDERQQTVITEAHFFEPYKKELRELFTALGRDDQWSDDPRVVMDYVQGAWIGAEHGNSAEKDQYTPEQEAAAMEVIKRFGFLVDETLPPAGMHFDEAVVVGGTTQANYRREAIVHKAIDELGVSVDTITLWLGQRPREARDGTNDELLSTEGRFAGHDISGNAWVKRLQEQGRWDKDNEWGLTETDLGRIALNKLVDGNLQPYRINLEVTDVHNPHQGVRRVLPGVPTRIITSYEFSDADGQDYVAMNAAATDRGEGRPPRHTTRSCTIEWLQTRPPRENAVVLYSSSNPHTLRTLQDTHEVLEEMERGDITLVMAGASAAPNAPTQLFLGEIGRLLYNDVKRNYTPAA